MDPVLYGQAQKLKDNEISFHYLRKMKGELKNTK
jgi:hypothetical protein